jgi:translation elongation factor EF-Tu-like GTPase
VFGVSRDIEVELTFLRTEEGGRAHPARNGYRPQFFYEGYDWDAEHEYIGVEMVYPGQTVRAYLSFLSPHLVSGIESGEGFLIREGTRTIARGKILRILDLEKSALEIKNLKKKAH